MCIEQELDKSLGEVVARRRKKARYMLPNSEHGKIEVCHDTFCNVFGAGKKIVAAVRQSEENDFPQGNDNRQGSKSKYMPIQSRSNSKSFRARLLTMHPTTNPLGKSAYSLRTCLIQNVGSNGAVRMTRNLLSKRTGSSSGDQWTGNRTGHGRPSSRMR